MKAILTITVTKKINKKDKKFYEQLLEDGDICGLYESFDPETEGKHKIIFEDEGKRLTKEKQ